MSSENQIYAKNLSTNTETSLEKFHDWQTEKRMKF